MIERSVEIVGPHGRTVQFLFDGSANLVAIVDDGVAFTANARLTEWIGRFQTLTRKARAELTSVEYAEFVRQGRGLLVGPLSVGGAVTREGER